MQRVTADKEQKKRDNIFWEQKAYLFGKKNGEVKINYKSICDLPKRLQNESSIRVTRVIEGRPLTSDEVIALEQLDLELEKNK